MCCFGRSSEPLAKRRTSLLSSFQGANSHGQLGQGTVSEQCDEPAPAETTWSGEVRRIVCGGGHTFLVDDQRRIYACGRNDKHQLGFEGGGSDRFTRVWSLGGVNVEKVTAGWDSSAAVSDNDAVHLWGSNEHGQLGLPRYDYPGSVRPIRLELRASDVSMGLRHTALLDINGFVWTTGYGKRGQLGHGEGVTSLDRFQKIESVSKISRVACGQHHTLAWSSEDGTMYAWGDNAHGQLGVEPKGMRAYTPVKISALDKYRDSILEIFTGWTNSAVLLKDGRAVYWGRNNYGQLGCESDPSENFNVISFEGAKIECLALGSEHSVCALDDGTVRSWGWNEHGNTGTGVTGDVRNPTVVKGIMGKVVRVDSGSGCGFAVVEQC